MRTLVPMVVGQTAEAQQKSRAPRGRQWDETSFFQVRYNMTTPLFSTYSQGENRVTASILAVFVDTFDSLHPRSLTPHPSWIGLSRESAQQKAPQTESDRS